MSIRPYLAHRTVVCGTAPVVRGVLLDALVDLSTASTILGSELGLVPRGTVAVGATRLLGEQQEHGTLLTVV